MSSHQTDAGTWVDVGASDGSGVFGAYVCRPSKGNGPALILLQEIFGVNENMRWNAQRYAEEGYVVAVPDLFWRMTPRVELPYGPEGFEKALDYGTRLDLEKAVQDIFATATLMSQWPEVTKKKPGVLGFCMGGKLAFVAACRGSNIISCAVSYYGVKLDDYLAESSNIQCPIIFHFGGKDTHTPPSTIEAVRNAMADNGVDAEVYVYSSADHAFSTPFRPDRYHRFSAALAFQRSLTLLQREIGPRLHLDTVWDLHCSALFSDRDTDLTMATMVEDNPYVNHIPTMTGGRDKQQLAAFYTRRFIPQIPDDFIFTPISRTVAGNQVVDEFVVSFTHTIRMDWILPGVEPTNKFVSVPTVAIVRFRGDKICHEHLYWDQGSVLVQVGLLDPDAVPVTGIEATDKLLDDLRPFS